MAQTRLTFVEWCASGQLHSSHLAFSHSPLHRLILQSFQLSSKLLARAEQVRLDEKCVRQLEGSWHCGVCLENDPGTRLCGSTCRAMVSSCVASSELAPISQSWKDLAQSLNNLVNSVVLHRNPETIFASYTAMLNETLDLVRSKNEISKKVCVAFLSPVIIAISELARYATDGFIIALSAISVLASESGGRVRLRKLPLLTAIKVRGFGQG